MTTKSKPIDLEVVKNELIDNLFVVCGLASNKGLPVETLLGVLEMTKLNIADAAMDVIRDKAKAKQEVH